MNKNLLFILGMLVVIIGAGLLIFKNTTVSDAAKIVEVTPTQQVEQVEATTAPTIAPTIDMKKNITPTTKPASKIDSNKKYTATMKTSEGTMEIELYASKTPITVNNFVTLAKKNYYDNTIFHRVIKGFMIQGGDPTGTGSGGPGYMFDDEPFTGEYTRGTLAMANAGPNTNGSQFFIMHQDYALPKNYVIFGKVTSGIDVVDKIATAPTKPGGENSSPVTPAKILSVMIVEK